METLLQYAINAALEAGKAIMEVYAQPFEVYTKDDDSPVTQADLRASNIIKTVADDGYGFRCNRCEGSLSGASSAFIHSDGTLRLGLSGASDLHYTGNASTTGTHTSGASNLIHDTL